MKSRYFVAVLALLIAGCSREGEFGAGGIYVTRSLCPQVGIPAATGDITLFNPSSRTDAAAIDVTATITNVRATCDETGSNIVSTVSFDVLASRTNSSGARSVVLPYFDIAMEGGERVIAKRIGRVAVNFEPGSNRAQTSGQATIQVSRSAVTLPEDIRKELVRERKPGDADAAIDPMSKPNIREAVSKATYEHLIGFQLTPEQLRYNATR